jgi:(p)ppGpp synthase/HD superfamily hydrolase
MTDKAPPGDLAPRPLGVRFERALAYANHAHCRQARKGTDMPYMAHLLGVCSLALELGADEDQAIAALLHDSVEDQGGSARLKDIQLEFGDDVAQIVMDCTDGELDADRSKPRDWRCRKEVYLASLANKPERSLLVSLADKTHNARAIQVDFNRIGEAIFERFTGKKDGTLWYYGELVLFFSARLPNKSLPLCDAFAAFNGTKGALS